MGLRVKRKAPTPIPLTDAKRLTNLSDGDVFLLLETSLMNAQQRLSEYQVAPRDARGAALAWLHNELVGASVATLELRHRL